MNGAPFRAIGGAVVADHGPLSLAEARALARFYASEAGHWRDLDGRAASDACARRAGTLRDAVTAAEMWRRAAGWADPDAADDPLIRAPARRPERHATPPPRRRAGR
jgi:hypothetical protein